MLGHVPWWNDTTKAENECSSGGPLDRQDIFLKKKRKTFSVRFMGLWVNAHMMWFCRTGQNNPKGHMWREPNKDLWLLLFILSNIYTKWRSTPWSNAKIVKTIRTNWIYCPLLLCLFACDWYLCTCWWPAPLHSAAVPVYHSVPLACPPSVYPSDWCICPPTPGDTWSIVSWQVGPVPVARRGRRRLALVSLGGAWLCMRDFRFKSIWFGGKDQLVRAVQKSLCASIHLFICSSVLKNVEINDSQPSWESDQ